MFLFDRYVRAWRERGYPEEKLRSLKEHFEIFMKRLLESTFGDIFKLHELLPDNEWAQLQRSVLFGKNKGTKPLQFSYSERLELIEKIEKHKKGQDIN